MIKKVTIDNFQSHEHTEIEFNKGVNVISGTSDSGKSAIIRAITWVLFNDPLGEEFRSWFADKKSETIVTIEFDDGNVVSRIRSNKRNEYIVNGGKPLKAMKTSVPDKVTEVTRMHDINMQPQYKSYFLLDEKPGKVAKSFNEVADLTLMDDTMQESKSRVREKSDELKAVEKTIKEEKEKFEALKDVPAMVDEFTIILNGEKYIEEDEEQIQNVDALITTADTLIEQLSHALPDKAVNEIEALHMYVGSLVVLSNSVIDINKVLDSVLNLDVQLNAIGDLDTEELDDVIANCENTGSINEKIGQLSGVVERVVSYNKPVNELKIVDEAIQGMNELISAFNDACDDDVDEFGKLINDIETTAYELKYAIGEENKAWLNYEAYRDEIGVCPTCERAY